MLGSLQNRLKETQCNLQNGIRKIQTRETRATNKREVTTRNLQMLPVLIVEKQDILHVTVSNKEVTMEEEEEWRN